MQPSSTAAFALRLCASIALLSFTLVLAACGGGDSSGSTGTQAVASKSKSEQVDRTTPKVVVPSGPPPKKLAIEDIKTGSGPTAKAGEEVTVQYVGVEFKNGKQIDSSWERGEPFAFKLGSGTVIPGWDKGVPGMKVGGRRRLVIPSKLAYGSGALVFVIDLVAIGGPIEEREEREPKVKVPNGPPPKQLVVNDLKAGSGAEVKPGDEIVVDYVAINYKTGKKFESTWERADPGKFTMNSGELIQGWLDGLKGMKVGGRRELIIPSRLAYKTGTLIYVIDLVSAK